MRKILLIKAGSLAIEVEEIVKCNGYNEIAFLEDNANVARCRRVIEH